MMAAPMVLATFPSKMQLCIETLSVVLFLLSAVIKPTAPPKSAKFCVKLQLAM